MRILVTGASGMLGLDLCRVLGKEHVVIGLDKRRADLLTGLNVEFIDADIVDRRRVNEVVPTVNPDIVIHAAAFTDVDGCEIDPDKAFDVNLSGTENVALAAESAGAALIYISTDFVFDGEKDSPYLETDEAAPLSIYGETKFEGEEFVRKILKRHVIVRSSWLFGSGGDNFINKVLKRAHDSSSIRVVNDQIGTPTSTSDLSSAILKLVDRIADGRCIGTYHITNGGGCSRYEEALKIIEHSGLRGIEVVPISSNDIDAPANRPGYSVLDNSKYNDLIGEGLRDWNEAVREYIANSADHIDQRAKEE